MEKRQYWGYIDKSGEYVIKPQFDGAADFHEGLAVVKIDWRRGYIDKTGVFVIEPQFQKATDFHDGIAQVQIDDNLIYIDKKGQETLPPLSPMVETSEPIEWPIRKVEGDKVGYVDEKDEFVIKPSYFDAGPFSDGLARVKKGRTSQWSFIDRNGKPAFKEKFEAAGDFHEGLAKVLVKI